MVTMTDTAPRPGVGFLGFALATGLLTTLAVLTREDAFARFGWRGGEYALSFLAAASGAVLGGVLLRQTRPPWRSLGTGLVVGGSVGLLLLVAVAVMLIVLVSQMAT